ncbi:hypothetical protein LINPERHAP2_LOCUS33230 [Linum perenne]
MEMVVVCRVLGQVEEGFPHKGAGAVVVLYMEVEEAVKMVAVEGVSKLEAGEEAEIGRGKQVEEVMEVEGNLVAAEAKTMVAAECRSKGSVAAGVGRKQGAEVNLVVEVVGDGHKVLETVLVMEVEATKKVGEGREMAAAARVEEVKVMEAAARVGEVKEMAAAARVGEVKVMAEAARVEEVKVMAAVGTVEGVRVEEAREMAAVVREEEAVERTAEVVMVVEGEES